MKVKMKEVFQSEQELATLPDEGFKVKILQIGETYIVDESFGGWLLEHGKADEVKSEYVKPVSKPVEESLLNETPQKSKKK